MPCYLFIKVGAWIDGKKETFHEKRGNFHQAQGARLRLFAWDLAARKFEDPFELQQGVQLWRSMISLIQNDNDLNFEIQHEAALQHKHQVLDAMLRHLADTSDVGSEPIFSAMSQMQAIENELCTVHEQIWKLERKAHRILRKFPVSFGPVKRAVCANRARPDWHLTEFLREDCEGRGGCCGRGCGCCAGPRSAHRAKWGHCTAACVCCERARGFAVGKHVRWEPVRLPALDDAEWITGDMLQLLVAYAFGLTVEDDWL
ncbi:uncharacterized protein BO95DRAFT_459519 [Aspergillus brunneoviolaceus CBS 621.78]|uniref:Uncharacterized protein n=1 Tax=Aspergillus brunneoviolaceus CBS 621.78 TaxID=1450534 RepID=A0ACD1GL03_9EURO|nr:hypothetical protein BO95DRAFT_459519 [Aspergillus brunneoviolaceus CBS 621.78]RAH50010.1 hypothetical protein BO95DRAFT_459519 [Aspergillus brunneoviolaceus CBS 621.78]